MQRDLPLVHHVCVAAGVCVHSLTLIVVQVRRASVRALLAIIEAQKSSPSTLWECGAFDSLLARFKEREENVRVDVIEAFSRLLSHSIAASALDSASSDAASSDAEMKDSESKYDDPSLVAAAIGTRTPSIIKASIAQLKLKSKNDHAKTQTFALLGVLCSASSGLGEEKQVSALFNALKITLAPAVSKSLKLESLQVSARSYCGSRTLNPGNKRPKACCEPLRTLRYRDQNKLAARLCTPAYMFSHSLLAPLPINPP